MRLTDGDSGFRVEEAMLCCVVSDEAVGLSSCRAEGFED